MGRVSGARPPPRKLHDCTTLHDMDQGQLPRNECTGPVRPVDVRVRFRNVDVQRATAEQDCLHRSVTLLAQPLDFPPPRPRGQPLPPSLASTPDIWIDGTLIPVTWDEPMPGVGRPLVRVPGLRSTLPTRLFSRRDRL